MFTANIIKAGVSNVIKYKFSYGVATCPLNWKNAGQRHLRFSDNSRVRETYSLRTLHRMEMQGYCDFFRRTIYEWTPTEVYVYIGPHQGAKIAHFDVSNVSYQKFYTTPLPTCSVEKTLTSCNGNTMVCPPVRGNNPRALPSGLSPVLANKP